MDAERKSSREEYLIEATRQVSDAQHALEGAEYVIEDDGKIRFMFTQEQVERAKKEMDEINRQTNQQFRSSAELELPKPKRMNVELSKGTLEIENDALCAFDDLLRAKRVIEMRYPELVKGLPEDHPWRQAKISHGLIASAGLQNVLRTFQRDMKEENYYLLLLIAGSHDIGRPLMAKKHLGMLPAETGPTKTDGQYAVEVLREWNILTPFPPRTRDLIEYSVVHHSDRVTPPLPEQATETEKLQGS